MREEEEEGDSHSMRWINGKADGRAQCTAETVQNIAQCSG
jgi:hypothetical protein